MIKFDTMLTDDQLQTVMKWVHPDEHRITTPWSLSCVLVDNILGRSVAWPGTDLIRVRAGDQHGMPTLEVPSTDTCNAMMNYVDEIGGDLKIAVAYITSVAQVPSDVLRIIHYNMDDRHQEWAFHSLAALDGWEGPELLRRLELNIEVIRETCDMIKSRRDNHEDLEKQIAQVGETYRRLRYRITRLLIVLEVLHKLMMITYNSMDGPRRKEYYAKYRWAYEAHNAKDQFETEGGLTPTELAAEKEAEKEAAKSYSD